ncbi:hypothetical protein [Streptomyces spectabilis]|uniref:Uncharacterized protein n=1 Tax=Streptomyces spectabilis TaxID=68270 RepID=A0A7W8EZM0_STRST|nr:hypothetical protein [Streptomyces spectabilis]MBB5109334.1 hypothetical protein [Streptomyces spectabilis]
MASGRAPRLADAAEIAAEQGLTPARINGLHNERAKNADGVPFPASIGARGRARLWDHAEVTDWFAHRKTAEPRPTPPSFDPGKLLNAAEASRFLGYKNSNQVTTYVRDHPGYFAKPDVVEEQGTEENPYHRRLWRAQTLLDWQASRPGRGRRATANRPSPLPDVSADGDPNELLGASQAAALLGFKNLNSFSSSLAQGNLPLLKETDGVAENAGRQTGRRRWTRRRILEQAAQRKR